MEWRRGLGVLAAAVVACAGLVVPGPVVAGAGGVSCAERKADVLDMVGWAVVRTTWWFTSSLESPARLGERQAAITMQRIERQQDRALAVCAEERLQRLTRFVETAREVTAEPMRQAEVEALLAAYDRYDPAEDTRITELHRCQRLLGGVSASYEVHYSGPKPYGKKGWVILALQNDTDRDRYVTLFGWMVAVRALPGQGGEYSERHGGRVYGWGGSSSDLMLAVAHERTEGYASPSWYKLRLHDDGAIESVHPTMIVEFGRLGCAAPVRPVSPG